MNLDTLVENLTDQKAVHCVWHLHLYLFAFTLWHSWWFLYINIPIWLPYYVSWCIAIWTFSNWSHVCRWVILSMDFFHGVLQNNLLLKGDDGGDGFTGIHIQNLSVVHIKYVQFSVLPLCLHKVRETGVLGLVQVKATKIDHRWGLFQILKFQKNTLLLYKESWVINSKQVSHFQRFI